MYRTHPSRPAPCSGPVAEPGAESVLECGEAFDVLWVPEPAGRWALRRLIGYRQPALAPGPVALSEDGSACLYLVAPGARDDLPELLDWLEWGGIDLGLRGYGAGDRLARPKVWLHDEHAPAPEVIALLATIAQCCSRRLLRRAVPGQRAESGD
ncbi:hypothetical protein KDL01_21725 [Actinospica durhamensis]|uniref:Uncharacterized protein n=1 Tax=Actinospica durhamensis TaxID=1508375 RepID=A0A941EXS1_9ACTN|nr:hypothetical protein [Actinospica durhamensis]MBR7835909.1 hypothetical protein [Actinospica durhamensis]